MLEYQGSTPWPLQSQIMQLNGSGQEPRNRHFDWNFQVGQNPKSRKKTWQTGLKFNCSFPPEKCWLWIDEISETLWYMAKKQWGEGVRGWGGEGGRGGGWGWGERTLGLFVKSFPPAFREKQHRNIFSHHTGRLAKFGWILISLKISGQMAVMWFLPGAI